MLKYSIKILIPTLLFLLSKTFAVAQNDSNQNLQNQAVSILYDNRIDLVYAALNNKTANFITSNNTSNHKLLNGNIHAARGFRVLIYAGTDRNKANNIKADFMRRYPGNRVYMTYSMPQFKIKVGDFANRQDANNLYRALMNQYSPCMIVPDIVEINTFQKND